jgi:hypothetical protein
MQIPSLMVLASRTKFDIIADFLIHRTGQGYQLIFISDYPKQGGTLEATMFDPSTRRFGGKTNSSSILGRYLFPVILRVC